MPPPSLQLSKGTYESIIGNQLSIDEDECSAFQSAVSALSAGKLWSSVTAIEEWEKVVAADGASSDGLWAAIEGSECSSSPYEAILAALHCAQAALKGVSGAAPAPAHLELAGASAALYLALQRQPGARGRGLCSALTFHQVYCHYNLGVVI